MRGPFFRLYVHLVWATWDRMPLITEDVEARLYAAMKAKCWELRCETLAMGGTFDHVHLLVRFRPSIALSDLVQEVKGSSSHLMNHELAPDREFKWQGSYGALTVGGSGIRRVTEYIQNQKQHHALQRVNDEWEKCFTDDDELD